MSPIGLRTVIYRVADLDAAKDWYRRAFEVEPYYDSPFYVGFRVGGCELGLDPDLTEGKPGPGGSTTYWGVDSIASAFDRLVGLGAPVLVPVRDVGGGIQIGVVADPSGNAVGLIEEPRTKAEAGPSIEEIG